MTPRALLKEIILVDDGSDSYEYGRQLQQFVDKYPIPMQLIRTGRRSGIVQARVLAVRFARVS